MTRQYHAYSVHNFRTIPQLESMPESAKREIEVVSRVLPFKTNNYVVEELIDWGNVPDDPMYTLNFPRRELLKEKHFLRMEELVSRGASEAELRAGAKEVQARLNPDPSGQSANVPTLNGKRLAGAQHKYRETVLYFPQAGQTCHAYCTFCFRWPQFGGLSGARFAGRDISLAAEYVRAHPKVTDLLLTGGDPMVMNADALENCLSAFDAKETPHLRTIRIGTKSLSYWPYRYLTDPDSDHILRLFEKVTASGLNLAIMAHFNHPVELSTEAVRKAIRRIRETGARIHTQSPLLRNINDDPHLWSDMWRRQVDLGCIPYYMFVERNTGAKHFFTLPLKRCWRVFREAYRRVGGLCRTVRGPVMSATPGKVQVLGVSEVNGKRVFALQFIQGRNSDWVGRPFFAEYDRTASWLDDLKPAFGEREFFFERKLKDMLSASVQPMG